jgi:hypothetical protein
MLNWKLISIIVIFIIGFYLSIAYQQSSYLSAEQQKEYQQRQYLGYILTIISIILSLYFYYMGDMFLYKATMPGDCDDCNMYVKRHRGLIPYRMNELKQLTRHASACHKCSNMCIDRLTLAEKSLQRGIKTENIGELKKNCLQSTKYALLAKQELKRLAEKARRGYTEFWRHHPEAPAIHFPKVPE